jgi:hypothetical protein
MRAAFAFAKTADIALVSFYYLVFGITASIGLQLLGKFYEEYTPEENKKSIPRILLEVAATIFFIAVSFWAIRNLVECIPSPMDGIGGYDHHRLSHETTGQIAALTMLIFQSTLMQKVGLLNDRIFKKSQDELKKI